MKLLETEWVNYRNAVIPRDAGSAQLTESRRCFYAGAWALYALMMNRMEGVAEPTDGDMNLMASLDAEMREFTARVTKGWA
jgi:hypothetical protein